MQSFSRNRIHMALAWILLVVLLSSCNPAVPAQPVISTEPSGPAGNAASAPDAQNGYPGVPTSNPNTAFAYPGTDSDPNSKYTPIELDKVVAPKDAPKPEAGKASASGTLYSKSSHAVLWNFQFYFTPAQGDTKDQVPPVFLGAFKEKGDVLVTTDSKGEFQVANIPPGNYYMILVAPGDYQIAFKGTNEDTPRMVTFKADQAQPLGVILFP